MRHKKHHLPVIALVIALLLLAGVIYFALFFGKAASDSAKKDSPVTQMYAPESGLGSAEGGL